MFNMLSKISFWKFSINPRELPPAVNTLWLHTGIYTGSYAVFHFLMLIPERYMVYFFGESYIVKHNDFLQLVISTWFVKFSFTL